MKEVIDRLKIALSSRYHIERQLGSGGMATVYLARDLKHERQVAVKVLRPELAAALGKERFLQEIKIAANLRHPHILPLFDSGEADGFLFYVMPYEEGQSLRERLKNEGELPISEAVRIIRDMVDALSHSHEQGVVHRDLKPDNIMLSRRHALVTDFGVAKAVSEATGREQLTSAGVALGTPTYMAPEQAAADPHIDHRADIYAIGAVAYEMLTGRPPFLGTTPQMILTAHIADDPDPVTKYRASVPPALAQFILKCLEKKPADRWQSAEEMLPLLEALVTPGEGITSPGTLSVASGKSRRRVNAVTLAVAIVALGLVVFKLIPQRGGADLTPNRVVVIPFENRTGDESLDPIGVMAADWLTEGFMELVGTVEPVPTLQVIQLLERKTDGGEGFAMSTEDVAEETRAGTVVSGSFYQLGDSLEFRAQVLSAIEGAVIGITDPVRGTRQNPGEAIGLLRQQVTGIVAARFDPMMQVEIPDFARPPNYEAYQAYSNGLRAFVNSDWADALRHLERASELDTTYTRGHVLAIAVYSNMGQFAVAESLAVEAISASEGLSGYDRLRVEYGLAGLHGDRFAQYNAAREMVGLVPGGTGHYAAVSAAVDINRPQEALGLNELMLPHLPTGQVGGPIFYFDALTSSHHILGDHEQELVAALRGRDAWPSSLPSIAYEVRALAGLGRLDGVRESIEEGLPLRPESGWSPADVIRIAYRELVVHGHSDEARDLLARAYEWHGRGRPGDAQSESWRFDLAQTQYLDGALEEAAEVVMGLAAEFPQNVDYLGFLGAIAARQGDSDGARQIAGQLREFEQPYIRGQHTLWRARISSLLGDKDASVALIREALSQGRAYGPTLHADLDFQPLWDYPPYQELMRPKG